MMDNFDANSGERPNGDGIPPRQNSARPKNPFPKSSSAHVRINGHANGSPINFWLVVDTLVRRWIWLSFGGFICASAFLLLGLHLVKPKFTASAQLLRYESPAAKDLFQGAPMSVETFAGLIKSPELLRRVGTNVTPAIPPEQLIKHIKIDPQADSDILKVLLAASNARQAVELLSAYQDNALAFTKEYQAQMARAVANDYFKKQLEKMDVDITALEDAFRGSPASSEITNRVNAINSALANSRRASPLVSMLTERLNRAMGELTELSSKFYEIHPQVRAKQAEIDSLKSQIASASTNISASGYVISGVGGGSSENTLSPELEIMRTKLLSVQQERIKLASKLTEAESLATEPPGMVEVLAPASMKTVQGNWRRLKIGIFSAFGGFLGIGGSLMLILLVEFTDKRLRTAADVERVTGLQVLTSLGNLHRMPPEKRSLWAFRTWTMLQGRLSRSANHGLVCGVTSCTEGEGRSTWINLLAQAASLTGFRVLTIATKPSPTHFECPDETVEPVEFPDHEAAVSNGNHSQAIATNVLASPAAVTEQLTGPRSQPVVHIPLPGWVWNLERRKEWREALNHWRRIDNLVILVELPPASVAEAVLLGSNLPNLIWLTDCGRADAGETRAQLQTLRHARCNLVGAVLNRDSSPSLRKRFPRWLGAIALAAGLGIDSASGQNSKVSTETGEAATALAAEASTGPVSTNVSFSIVSPAQRAAWQQHLTLGPGDVLTLALYGQPEVTRTEVAIGPDGRISFLEAQDIMAGGLTIDELRAKLDEALGQYRRAPRSMITPIAFKSKKYYMLGKVMTKGVYTLDRPITVLEAIARAHGLENGLMDRNIVDLADFQRSFLMRGGKRFALNFEKLFLEGDLSQNIPIEPGDYLYFPSTNVKQVYVVGEVRLPGPVSYTPETTVIAAISARGGYTDRAYKARVLVVRGSINHPQAIAVDTHAMLDGIVPDFRLQPKDIIYVNSRPFIRVEELTELAATAFIQSLITTWTGVHVIPPQ
jgi:protein involved in polysaccharide export with SLBB domain/capsular polysaccharide biosynthesis protein